jgi:tetratricopeptide (TPR) repeat protein
MAVAEMQWGKYEAARPILDKALNLLPNNARSLYYLALVDRNMGNMDVAIADLQKVVTSFPQSLGAHRELGFSHYLLHNYELARTEYEAVQALDPDDMAGHYNLSMLYRRLGLKDLANRQAAIFADQKDDPTASIYALEFLRSHQEIANENIMWHTHEIDIPIKPRETAPKIVAPVILP